MGIIGYIHICQKGEWKRSFNMLINSIRQSNLYDNTSVIRIGVINDGQSLIDDSILQDTKFQVKKSLSIKLDKERPIILIGNLPPVAIKIEHPPLYLAMMLETLSMPYTFDELWQKIYITYPKCNIKEVEKSFNELSLFHLNMHKLKLQKYKLVKLQQIIQIQS